MATVLTVYCDHCGVTILDDRVTLDLRCGNLRTRRPTVDLCPKCSAEFDAWLVIGIAKAKAEKTAIEAESVF